MKKQITLIVLIIGMMMLTETIYGQWLPAASTPGSLFTQPIYPGFPNDILSVGIGDFNTPGLSTNSFLHINSSLIPLLPANGSIASFGEVFRSTCPRDISTFWRMERIYSGAPTEYGMLYSLNIAQDALYFPGTGTGEGIHYYVQSSYADEDNRIYGDLRFNTGSHIKDPPGIATPRMRVLGQNGYVGIGDYRTFVPQNLLHLHIPDDDQGNVQNVYQQFTNGNTGAGGNDGFRIGINYRPKPNVTATNYTVTELRNFEDSPILFYTNNGERMNINTRTINHTQRGAVAISELSGQPITFPRSVLHLGHDYLAGTGVGGWRTWMNIGSFCELQTDFSFFGIIPFDFDTTNAQNDHDDAVIAWGDNINHAQDGADNLRVIFSGPMTGTHGRPSFYTGLETARITPYGFMGIGNFGTAASGGSALQPARKLEIYDNHWTFLSATAEPAAPQLRLTYSPEYAAGTGQWIDFQTTNYGDLQITANNGGSAGNIGINIGSTSPLTRTLDVNGNLRLRTLPTSTYDKTGTTSGFDNVLVSDGNGKIFWRNDIGNISGCNTATVNYLTKWLSVSSASYQQCNTSIYEDGGSNVAINYTGSATSLAYKFASNGPSLFMNACTGSGCAYTNYPTTAFTGASATPLSVLTSPNNNAITIYSQETAYNDRLRLYSYSGSTNNGWSYIEPRDMPLVIKEFGSVGTAHEYFATDFTNDNTVIQSDYSAHPPAAAASLADNSRLLARIRGASDGAGIAMEGLNESTTTSAIPMTGVTGITNGTRTGSSHDNRGGYFEGTGSEYYNYGLIGTATGTSSTSVNYGGSFSSMGSGANTNYGIYAIAANGTTNWAGYFVGDTHCTSGVWTSSDSTLKQNIANIPNVRGIIEQLAPKQFEFRTSQFPRLVLPSGMHYGVIAQDLQQVLPNLIKQAVLPAVYDSLGNVSAPAIPYKTVNYTELIPFLISAAKDQYATNDTLKNRIDSLVQAINIINNTLASCCNSRQQNPQGNNNQNPKQQLTVELADAKAIILNQNDPNPFAEQTKISWSIPVDNSNATLDAKLFFFDNNGNILRTVKIEQAGYGELTVYASNLSDGAYTYSLVVSGKVIDSKRMVKAK